MLLRAFISTNSCVGGLIVFAVLMMFALPATSISFFVDDRTVECVALKGWRLVKLTWKGMRMCLKKGFRFVKIKSNFILFCNKSING